MPSLIIQHFEPLCAFLMPLLLQLSEPQQRHALNVVGALLVCSSTHKTLTTLTAMLRLPHADHFALADFFRQSGGCPVDVRRAVLTTQMATLARVVQTGEAARLPLLLSVDDSLAVKDVATRALEAVTFHHDHVKQRRQSRDYTNAARYVTVSAQVNGLSFPLTWRLYLSRKQVKRLNRTRTGSSRLTYRKLIALVIEMLDEIAPHVPSGQRVYVLFDSWYASAKLLNDVRRRGWHFICAVKSNRTLSGSSVSTYWRALSRQRIKRVTVNNTQGSHTYHTRYTTGRLRGVPQPVGAVFSKRSPRKGPVAFFVTSDLRLRAQTARAGHPALLRLALARRNRQLPAQTAARSGRLPSALGRSCPALVRPGLRRLRLHPRAHRRSLAPTARPAPTIVSRRDRRAAALASRTPDRVRGRPGATWVEQPATAGSHVPHLTRPSLSHISRCLCLALAERSTSCACSQPGGLFASCGFANVQHDNLSNIATKR